MLALRLYGPKDIRLDEIDVPVISDDDILLKVDAAALCGTDVRMMQNGYRHVSEERPLVLGHEFAGTVVEAGRNVPLYEEGMQVAVAPNIGCGLCLRCVSGRPHLCNAYKAFGINMDGAFAEYVKIPQKAILQGNLMPLPNGLSPEDATLNEPLSCVYNGFLKCGIVPGEHVLIVGAGPIGVMHAMFARIAGAARIIVCDLLWERLFQCQSLLDGIDVCRADQLADFVMEKTRGDGLDVAVIACPSPRMQSAVIPLMNYGGRVNFFGGVPALEQMVPINTNLVHYKELCLTGSTRASTEHFRKTLQFISDGLINVRKLITARFHISDVLDAFDMNGNGLALKKLITFEPVLDYSKPTDTRDEPALVSAKG
ncbi:MAG: alcohol dehydrogenase catalytic domain-containing protein [Planctomycetaceae bacterium]|nr:alcohol dehydrogenase catalytic domain-containing protein [Planctomycetaceae bacterium]